MVLDRDGTINKDSPDYIKSPSEWKPIPGSLDAIARLNRSGWTVVVATNQSGLGRGMFPLNTLYAIHQEMNGQLAAHGAHVDSVFFCPHVPDDHCECRKPKPGLLHAIAERYGIAMTGVPVIGDSARDLDAAAAVGARPILVRTGNGRKTLRGLDPDQVEHYTDLASAVDSLLAHRSDVGA